MLKIIPLVYAESLGANAPKGKKLEAIQITTKQRVKSLGNDIVGSTITRHKDIIHPVLQVPLTPLLTSVEVVSCIKDPECTNGVESYEGAVDLYADGTWQICQIQEISSLRNH